MTPGFATQVLMPIAVLAALAVLLPRAFIPAATRIQFDVTKGMALTALTLLILGAVLFAALYALRGADIPQMAQYAAAPTALYFLTRSTMAAIIWAPVLALVWLARAQGVEKRKGRDIAAKEARS